MHVLVHKSVSYGEWNGGHHIPTHESMSSWDQKKVEF